MNRILLCLVVLLFSPFGFGQGEKNLNILPPADMIHDPERLLDPNDPETIRLEKNLILLREQHNYWVYVWVHSVFLGDDLSVFAEDLAIRWRQDKEGILVILESDTGNAHVAGIIEQSAASAHVLPAVSVANRIEIVKQSYEEAFALNPDPRRPLTTLPNILTDKLIAYLDAAPTGAPSFVRILPIILGGIIIGFLSLFFLRRSIRRRSDPANQPRSIPPSSLPERLGAPYAGGCAATSSFAPKE